MATITHLATSDTLTVRLVAHPWAEETSLDPVEHVPLDGTEPWIAMRPTPAQRPTLDILLDDPEVDTLAPVLDLLRTPGVISITDTGALIDLVVSRISVRQAYPAWVVTITGIEV